MRAKAKAKSHTTKGETKIRFNLVMKLRKHGDYSKYGISPLQTEANGSLCLLPDS